MITNEINVFCLNKTGNEIWFYTNINIFFTAMTQNKL